MYLSVIGWRDVSVYGCIYLHFPQILIKHNCTCDVTVNPALELSVEEVVLRSGCDVHCR